MDAQKLHDACYEAMCQCPQFRGWDDDGEFPGYGQFGKIPSKGLYKTIQFWREWGDLLWERGYEKALPQGAQDLFDNIERVIEQAIKDYSKGPCKTTPPAATAQRQPLTDEQIDSVCAPLGFAQLSPREVARAIEAAHGITGEKT